MNKLALMHTTSHPTSVSGEAFKVLHDGITPDTGYHPNPVNCFPAKLPSKTIKIEKVSGMGVTERSVYYEYHTSFETFVNQVSHG
jgi:hypothetical protein